jgi:hypothetical protein
MTVPVILVSQIGEHGQNTAPHAQQSESTGHARVVTPFTVYGVIDPTPIAFIFAKKIPSGIGLSSLIAMADLQRMFDISLRHPR